MAGTSPAAPQPFVFSEGGRARAAVVIPKDADEGTRFTADELVDYLNRITDARFTIATAPLPGWNTIHIGRPYKTDRYEEFVIKASNDGSTLELAGADQRGNVYAVYELLETLGCGFWSPDNETVPHETNLVLTAGFSKKDAPSFSYRNVDTPYANLAFTLKLRANAQRHKGDVRARLTRMGGDASENIMHTLHRKGGWMWDGTYFKDHPEWYGVALKQDKETGEWVPGDRDRSILCPTHPEMRKQLVKEVDEWLAANYPTRRSVSLSPEDTWQHCNCETCTKLINSDDARTASVLYIDLINHVANALRPKYPKAHFNLLSYGAAFTAPKDVKRFRMAPGTGVAFAHHWRNHGLPIDCNERFLPRFLAWRELCDRFLFWDYYNNFHCTENPFPNSDILGPAFKFYRDNKFDGGFCQMPFARLSPLSDLNYWVKNRLMWNPDADAPALIDHYIKGAYGPAAPHVRRYLDIILHAKRRQRWVWIGDYVDDTSNFLSDMDAINCMRAMEAARRSVQNDPNKGRRIDVDRLHFQVYHIGAMRYPDLIGPAKAARYNLRPWQFYVDGWKREATSYFNSREFVGNQQLSNENQQLMWWTRYFDMIKDTAETPTAWPKRQNLSHVITPADMTGPARFSVTNDAAGARAGELAPSPYSTATGEDAGLRVGSSTNATALGPAYARLTYGWGKGEPKFMSPNWCEAGFTVESNKYEGVWYVFSNVRVSTTATNDPAAAYTGIYAPWHIGNQRVKKSKAEICSMRIERTVGDHAWRLACLGQWRLRPDTRVWVMPGVVNQTHDLAVRNFTLVAPEVFEKDITLENGIGSRRFGANPGLCTGAVSRKRDDIDRYDYHEIDCLSTNQPSAIVAAFPNKNIRDFAASGDKYLFARVRVLASDVLLGDAARIQLVMPGPKGTPERVVDEIAISASRGDEAWQHVCLGRETLDPDMLIRVFASNAATTSVALHEIVLVSPEFLETSVKVP
jgi:hypothetical protein